MFSSGGTNGLDANPAAIIADFLTNPRYGAGFPPGNLGDLGLYSTYCQAAGIMLSPLLETQQEAQQHISDIVKITNSAIVWSGGLLKIIPYGDQMISGNGTVYAPNTTPIYSLGEDDFIVQESSAGTNSGVTPGGDALRSGSGPITGGFSDDPVHITRSTPADASNSIQLECLDRSNNYNTSIVEAFDQAAIDLYGIRRDSSLKARAIVDPVNVGPIVAQLLLQRALLFRNSYTFKLGWKYCLIEPMDLVQITDARLGASALTVRITAVEEDDEGTLSITAEEFALLKGDLEIWVALSGGANWGGAQVWVSSDGSSYAMAGTVTSPAPQGVLSADLPAHSSPDTVDTLAVDLSQSQGKLTSVSATDAANLVTLCYVGGELIGYQTATLTAVGKYDLATLYRGAYGSAIADHPAGSQFARLDTSIGRFSYPNTLIGQAIYLKFPAINIVGGALESLASVPAYTYVVKGAGQASSIVVSGSYSGKPGANLMLQNYVFATPTIIPAGLSGSQGATATAATAVAVFDIQKNGATVGTMVFDASANVATFTMNSAAAFNAGDVLTIVAPATPDPTLANLSWTITGFI